MAETAKRQVRGWRIWSLHTGGRTIWDELGLSQRVEKLLLSRFWASVRKGLPLAVLCLLCGRVEIVGGAMPFAAAMLAAVMTRGLNVHYAAAGCIAGALMGGSTAQALACAVLYALHILLSAADLKPNDLTCVLASGIAAGCAPLFFMHTPYDGVMAAVAGGGAMLLTRLYATAMRVNLRSRKLLSTEEIVSLSVLGMGLLAGFSGISVYGVSPALAAMMLICAGVGYLGGAGAGAAVGVVTGLMIGLTQNARTDMLCAMALIGLLPGMLSPLGRLGSAGAMLLAALLAGAITPQFISFVHMIEAGIALLAFLCIPASLWKEWSGLLARSAQIRRSAVQQPHDLKTEVRGRILEYAQLYGRMAQILSGRGQGGQYAAMGSALHAVANDLGAEVVEEPELAQEVAQALDAAHVHVTGVQVQRIGEKQRVCVQIKCQRRDGLCDKRMTGVISHCMHEKMRILPTGICPMDGACALVLEPAKRYEVSAGFASRPLAAGAPCGDTCTSVSLPEGQYMMAIADGMGHGARAQEESRAAVDLLEDFLLARFSPEAALAGVNDLLLRQDTGECFSTMDLALVDQTTGLLCMMKIGAVNSYIKRNRRMVTVTGDALPMGIMEKVRPSVTKMQLQDGDVLVMMSDGVIDALDGDEGWLVDRLSAMNLASPSEAAHQIVELAAREGDRRDDMTVGVLRLYEL